MSVDVAVHDGGGARLDAALALKLHNIVASGVWCLEPALMLLCCYVL
jgi:hypothetical protein